MHINARQKSARVDCDIELESECLNLIPLRFLPAALAVKPPGLVGLGMQ